MLVLMRAGTHLVRLAKRLLPCYHPKFFPVFIEMDYEQRLQAKAVLLEQFNDEVDFNIAIFRVIGELGPTAIDEEEARECYAKFANETPSSLEADQELISGRFLRNQRAIGFRTSQSLGVGCNVYGTGGRFQLFTTYTEHCVVDTFHGIKKTIELDWSEIPNERVYEVNFSHAAFINNNVVLGVVNEYFHPDAMFLVTFDLVNCVVKFRKKVDVGVMSQHLFVNNMSMSILTNSGRGKPAKYSIIDMSNFTLETTELSEPLCFPLLSDNKLYGFRCSSEVDTKKLIEIQMTDGTRKEHEVDKRDLETNEILFCNEHVWIGNKLLVAQTTTHETSTNYELDIWTMKWTKSNIQVDGCVQKFSMDSNVLNVWAKNGEKEKFYQFLVDLAIDATLYPIQSSVL
ncbi:hypothetical protein M3Y95_01029800 [Aphelenchoides besseyi]|nr:hypothetical protein M3Y95_01029800 [Aphelenchoides besseyi]